MKKIVLVFLLCSFLLFSLPLFSSAASFSPVRFNFPEPVSDPAIRYLVLDDCVYMFSCPLGDFDTFKVFLTPINGLLQLYTWQSVSTDTYNILVCKFDTSGTLLSSNLVPTPFGGQGFVCNLFGNQHFLFYGVEPFSGSNYLGPVSAIWADSSVLHSDLITISLLITQGLLDTNNINTNLSTFLSNFNLFVNAWMLWAEAYSNEFMLDDPNSLKSILKNIYDVLSAGSNVEAPTTSPDTDNALDEAQSKEDEIFSMADKSVELETIFDYNPLSDQSIVGGTSFWRDQMNLFIFNNSAAAPIISLILFSLTISLAVFIIGKKVS